MSPATSRQQCNDLNDLGDTPEVAGFIIDDTGREIAITEQMIQQACAEFDRQWRPAPQRVTPR